MIDHTKLGYSYEEILLDHSNEQYIQHYGILLEQSNLPESIHILQPRPMMSAPPNPLTVKVYYVFMCWGHLWGVTPYIAKVGGQGVPTSDFTVSHLGTGMRVPVGPFASIHKTLIEGEDFLDNAGLAKVVSAIGRAELAIAQGRVV